jgi:LytS/YehU family sensor histidine kinase
MTTAHTLKEELSAVSRYLDQELLQLNGKVKREFYLDPEVDGQTPIPRNLMRVFVEDALRNDLLDELPDATLSISLHRTSLGILIMIADSGFRSDNGLSTHQQQSEGLKILSSYLPVFNRTNKVDVSYKVLNLTSENGSPGTRVMITIRDQ